MAVEALGLTLGALSVFAPIFNAGEDLARGFELTRSFGEDYKVIQRQLDVQYARLERTLERRVGDLPEREQSMPDPKVIQLLAEMKKHYEDRQRLMQHHGKCTVFHQDLQHTSNNPANTYDEANLAPPPTPSTGNATTPDQSTTQVEVAVQERDSAIPGHLKSARKERSKAGIMKKLHPKLFRAQGSKLDKEKAGHKTLEGKEAPEKEESTKVADEDGSMRKSESIKTGAASLGRHSGSIFETAEVRDEYERQRDAASNVQAGSRWSRRVSWAYSDKRTLMDRIDSLSRCNNEVERLLDANKQSRPTLLLRATQQTSTLSSTAQMVSEALKRVHESLLVLNSHSENNPLSHLSIQLREDCEANRRELASIPEVQLRDDSYVFNLQEQKRGDFESTADLLLVETLKYPSNGQDKRLDTNGISDSLQELKTLGPLDQGKHTPSGKVETWGFFRHPSHENDTNVLFHDSSSQWCSPSDLAGILASSNYIDHINPTHIIQLARLIMTSHIFFSPVRQSLAVEPRPNHFRYFCRVGQEARNWNIDDPIVLRPWLSCAFGSPQRYVLGEGSGIAKYSHSSTVELGLLLYQIYAGENLDYGDGQNGLMKARTRALRELNKVDCAVGITPAEIVQDLLSPNTLVSADGEMVYKNETEYILNAITTLASYEHHVQDTVTATERAPNKFSGSAHSFEDPPTMYRTLDEQGTHAGTGAGKAGYGSQSE